MWNTGVDTGHSGRGIQGWIQAIGAVEYRGGYMSWGPGNTGVDTGDRSRVIQGRIQAIGAG